MARSRKREDYQAPSRRAREARPRVQPAAPAVPAEGYFPPGTWKKVLVGGLLGAFLLAGIASYVLAQNRSERELTRALTAGTCTTDERSDPSEGGHVAEPTFAVDPPAGGDHTEQVAEAGVYAGEEVPADGLLVHALEHGYVVLWHRPGVETRALEQLQEEHAEDVLVVERASLPVPVAATAWERRLLCQQVEPAVLERFVDERVGQGPEDVPRG